MVTKQCAGCGNNFQVKGYRAETAKYCSRKCSIKANNYVGKGRTDLTGQVFSFLTVIESGAPTCKCQCVCGKVVDIVKNKLVGGRQKSCGCQHGAGIRAYCRKDYVGRSNGRLTCIDNLTTGPARKWRCECGNITIANAQDVMSGNTTSCGCNRVENASIIGAKYRDNSCHNKNRWQVTVDEKEINLRSGFEWIYAQYLIENGIRFEYEHKVYKLRDGLRYVPDFYLPDTNEYIEVKGHMTEKAQEKVNLFPMVTGNRLTVLIDKDIAKLLGKKSLYSFYAERRATA